MTRRDRKALADTQAAVAALATAIARHGPEAVEAWAGDIAISAEIQGDDPRWQAAQAVAGAAKAIGERGNT